MYIDNRHTFQQNIKIICKNVNNDNHVSALGETYCDALSHFPQQSQAFLLSELILGTVNNLEFSKIEIEKRICYIEYLKQFL